MLNEKKAAERSGKHPPVYTPATPPPSKQKQSSKKPSKTGKPVKAPKNNEFFYENTKK
jgi:hypothetical protein